MTRKIVISILVLILSICSTVFMAPNYGLGKVKYYSDSQLLGVGDNPEPHVETINYSTYSTIDVATEILFPVYHTAIGTDSCAPTAGAMIVVYYDYYFNNLIPNYEPGYFYREKYRFLSQNATVTSVMEELYNLMGTNSIEPGTNSYQFRYGLSKYFSNKGYSLNINDYSDFSQTTIINTINQQHPIALLLNSYDYYPVSGVSINDNSMTMVGYRKTIGHIVVAYGYQEFNFYINGNLFRTDKYLIVSFGDGTDGFLSINDSSCIDEAYTFSVS